MLVKEKGEEGCAGRESLQTAKHAGLPYLKEGEGEKNWVRRVSLGSAVLRSFVQVDGEPSFPGWGAPISLRNELSLAPPT